MPGEFFSKYGNKNLVCPFKPSWAVKRKQLFIKEWPKIGKASKLSILIVSPLQRKNVENGKKESLSG